jgi:GntR family transcriptional regulator, transcriptional repressor for pyruvate dehydrogenase complex
MAVDPIQRPRTYDLIADRLIALIAAGRLVPGSPIPTERELSERHGVGRSSVREALRILESQGVLAPGPGGALVVAQAPQPLTRSLRLAMTLAPASGMADLFELRRMIEVEAAALAARRRDEDQLEGMGAAIERMAQALAAADPAAYIDADLTFHLGVSEATGNRLLASCMHAIREALREALGAIFDVPESAARAVEEHRRLLAAIAASDPERAAAAMRTHLERVQADVLEAAR